MLRAARDGGTVADIAAALHLSEGTVRNHLSSAIGKTGARTRAEAVRLADEPAGSSDPAPAGRDHANPLIMQTVSIMLL